MYAGGLIIYGGEESVRREDYIISLGLLRKVLAVSAYCVLLGSIFYCAVEQFEATGNSDSFCAFRHFFSNNTAQVRREVAMLESIPRDRS
jgi:hypothetical protein